MFCNVHHQTALEREMVPHSDLNDTDVLAPKVTLHTVLMNADLDPAVYIQRSNSPILLSLPLTNPIQSNSQWCQVQTC